MIRIDHACRMDRFDLLKHRINRLKCRRVTEAIDGAEE